jgi:Tfp pilus assembly ATPase PilU
MQSGGNIGMQTMDNALMELVSQGIVAGKEAYQQANDKSKFKNVKDDD